MVADFKQIFGNILVGQTKPVDLENYQAKRKTEGYADKTIDDEIGEARTMINKAFDNDLVGLGGIIAFVELGFYAGNIYGAIASAHKYNKIKNRQFLDQLRKNTKISLSYDNKNKDILLSLQFVF